MQTITRREARAKGLTRFFTGRPCRRGHVFERFVSCDTCIKCSRESKYRAVATKGSRQHLKHNAEQRRRRAANPDRERVKRGLPTPTRPEPGACECCEQPKKRRLCLDHDHTTGAFRGWLCSGCNTAIGRLGDTGAGVRRAVAYLDRA